MKKQLIFGFVFIGILVTGCDSPDVAQLPSAATPESLRPDEDLAAETLAQMLKLATSGDWESYVDHYYGEQDKFRSPADRDALVRRFEQKWGETLLQGLNRAAKLPVRIDGKTAVFQDGEDEAFVLYRSESGDWKFHL